MSFRALGVIPRLSLKMEFSGPEEQTKACAEEILATVEEMRKLFTQEISLDHRYHGRMKGGFERKNQAKLEKQYKVEIMVPGRPSDPDLVIIAGQNEDDVFNCIEHLKDEEEDYVRGLDRVRFQLFFLFSQGPTTSSHCFGYSIPRVHFGERKFEISQKGGYNLY